MDKRRKLIIYVNRGMKCSGRICGTTYEAKRAAPMTDEELHALFDEDTGDEDFLRYS